MPLILEIKLFKKSWKIEEKSENRKNSEEKDHYKIWKIITIIVEIKDLKKNSEKIRNPDKFPDNKTIISYLKIKPLILCRNMVKTTYIERFEKNGDESEKKEKKVDL